MKAMHVVRLDGMYAKLPIESLQELGKVQVAGRQIHFLRVQ